MAARLAGFVLVFLSVRHDQVDDDQFYQILNLASVYLLESFLLGNQLGERVEEQLVLINKNLVVYSLLKDSSE